MNNNLKVVSLGEIMLRLSPPNNKRFRDTLSFNSCYGGGEANVSVSLSQLGYDSYFVSKVPDNDIGHGAIESLRKYGVKTDYIYKDNNRLGIYFLEGGIGIRSSKVIYDRENSSISKAIVDDFNIDKILENTSLFHFSGITPALSESCINITREFLKKAKEKNILVSCDLNFRQKLWTSKKAISVMEPLMEYVDICIGNEEDAKMCLGFNPTSKIEKGNVKASDYYNIFKEMKDKYNFRYIASSLRESYSASHNGWSGVLYDGNDFYESKRYEIEPINDRVGSGDAFSAGLIHGILSKMNPYDIINFATASSAIKHTIYGDFNITNEIEVKELIKNGGNGRVER